MNKTLHSIAFLLIYTCAFAQESRLQLYSLTDTLKTVCEIALPETTIGGAPKQSDVCFSPRWPIARNGAMPLTMAQLFHATRMEWVYLNEGSTYANSLSFVQNAHAMGYTVCGSVNKILPDNTQGSATYIIGRARNLDSNYIVDSWNRSNGCANNPDFKAIWLAHAKQQMDLGADGIQMDDPSINSVSGQFCYCPYCIADFTKYLMDSLSAQQQTELGVTDTFNYKQFSTRIRSDPDFAKTHTKQSGILSQHFLNFGCVSNLKFYASVHEQLNVYTGRNILYSCNTFGFNRHLQRAHQMGMFETYPSREGNPSTLYKELILPMRAQGKAFIGTFVSVDVAMNRRFISQMYAFGKNAIVPWDVFIGVTLPRFYGTPQDFADLYGFVRANAHHLDNYCEAAIDGNDLDETRYGDTPPVHLRGGSMLVRTVVRAQPGNPDAPVVIHLVEWANEPQPFTVVLDPRRFFGNRPVRVTLSAPAAYNSTTHQTAETSGDYSELSVQKIVAQGRYTTIDIPALEPWGILTVEPIAESGSSIWQPMIWVDKGSYSTSNMQVHISSPSQGTTIRYTLDGSKPTAASSLYTGPLFINKTSTIRACAVDTNGNAGPEAQVAFTYLGRGDASILTPDTSVLAANLKLWLKADALSANLHEGQSVNNWVASKGPAAILQNVTLSNGNPSKPPIFREKAINGLPVVAFEDPDHSLAIQNFSTENLAGKQFTIFMVSRSDDENFGLCGNGLAGGGGIPRLYLTRQGMYYEVLELVPCSSDSGLVTINTFGYDGQSLLTWVNGAATGSQSRAAPVSSFGGGNLAIPFWGGNTAHLGQMAEIIVYDRSLSSDERSGVESYLSDKYAIYTHSVWNAISSDNSTQINLKQSSRGSLAIYPNPGNGRYLNIGLSKRARNEITVKIYTISGIELMHRKSSSYTTICIPYNKILSPGIYVVKVSDGNNLYIKKFVINR